MSIGLDGSGGVSSFVTDRRSLGKVFAFDAILLEVSSIGGVLGLGSDFLCEKNTDQLCIRN